MLRVNISINILAMVEPTNLHENKTLAAAPDVSKPNVQTQKRHTTRSSLKSQIFTFFPIIHHYRNRESNLYLPTYRLPVSCSSLQN